MHERRGLHAESDALHWRPLLFAGLAGVAVMLGVWWSGPDLFAGETTAGNRIVEATVVEPASCTESDGMATVRLPEGPVQGEASLNACGHSQGERVTVAVPDDAGNEAGLAAPGLTVRSAEATMGYHSWYQPTALSLVALSCLLGGVYASLLLRVTNGSNSPRG